jgi:hypothetical protein
MNLRDAIALTGFFLGILLHLFLLSAFLKRRRKSAFELALLFLIAALLVWFSGNFLRFDGTWTIGVGGAAP